MQLKNNSLNVGVLCVKTRLLAGLVALPLLIACDGDGTTVTTPGNLFDGSFVEETNVEVVEETIVEVTGDTAALECIDTPPVGDGWGWNGTESCMVGEIQTSTGASTPAVDSSPIVIDTPDTDSQPVDIALLTSSVTDLVLVTGQTNALGANTGFDEFLDAPNQNVLAFTDSGWQIADLNQIWDRNFYPQNDPNTPPSNNFSLHFGKRIAERAPDRVVAFILVTSPDSGISDWGPNTDFFNSIRDKVSLAINDIPLKSRLDAILWHHGEADGEDRDEYSAALFDLVARFRSEPWFDDGRPFICGETAASPVNNQLNRLNTDADPWTSCVEGAGLAVLPNTDQFTASSLRTIGQRYADAYIEMWLGI